MKTTFTKRFLVSVGLSAALVSCESIPKSSETDSTLPSVSKTTTSKSEIRGNKKNAQDVIPGGGKKGKIDTSNANVFTNIAYANVSESQKLDLYIPKGNGPFPVIIYIHGGGFMFGSKDGGDSNAIIENGIKRGYAIVSVEYRLSKEATFPAAIDDVQQAILFVKKNASKYNLEANKMATWGGSAGGNLAALAGTKGSAAANTNVQAVVDWFGPIYFSTMDKQFADLGITPKIGRTDSKDSPESHYIGYTIGSKEAEPIVAEASPQSYISANNPAFFIQHGTADSNIPITQSEVFAQKLTETLGKSHVTFEKLEGAKHGGAAFETKENLDKVFAFLDQYLKA